jgi:Gas vesicle protein G
MGLLTGLLTFPLAPVRGTVWIAEKLAAQAEFELLSERALRARLAEAERAFDSGALTVEEYEEIEDGLLERIELLEEERRLKEGVE